jgi:Protease subunit of ATP-dependent Clp proteases
MARHEPTLSADYTPNPDRAIRIQGEIDKSMLARLEPQIQELTVQSRDPITLLIESSGRNTSVRDQILQLLRSRAPSDEPPCHVITIAITRAYSAAADLLSAGDFAVTAPGCGLLYHATRIPALPSVTASHGILLTYGLNCMDLKSAVNLARRAASRSSFLFSGFRSRFDEVRAETGNRALSDLKCFQVLLRRNLSIEGQRVLDLASIRCGRFRGLLRCFHKKVRTVRGPSAARIEKAMLDASIAFELGTKRRQDLGLRYRVKRMGDYAFFSMSFFGIATERSSAEFRTKIRAGRSYFCCHFPSRSARRLRRERIISAGLTRFFSA